MTGNYCDCPDILLTSMGYWEEGASVLGHVHTSSINLYNDCFCISLMWDYHIRKVYT